MYGQRIVGSSSFEIRALIISLEFEGLIRSQDRKKSIEWDKIS